MIRLMFNSFVRWIPDFPYFERPGTGILDEFHHPFGIIRMKLNPL